MRVSADIEKLLAWTYIDELPKRQLSSAEGLWRSMAEYGQRGGIDVGQGAAQRYPHFGLPHPDALEIEKAVGALGRVAVDWEAEFDIIVGDLAALVTINDVRPRVDIWRSTEAGGSSWPKGSPSGKLARAPDGRGVRASPRNEPRDVLMVNTINVAALVTMHAVKGTRPDWRAERMQIEPTPAERGPLGKVIGICKGKNRYTTGSYCPLRYRPSPVTIVQSRADYRAWHHALCALAATLKLAEHVPLRPAASPAPWIEGEKKPALFVQGIASKRPLPLNPPRKRAGPRPEKPKHSKVRRG